MKYKLPVVITPLDEGGFLAHCEQVKATATGSTIKEAIENLREAIEELIQCYSEEIVFQEISADSELHVIEVAL